MQTPVRFPQRIRSGRMFVRSHPVFLMDARYLRASRLSPGSRLRMWMTMVTLRLSRV